MSQILQLVVSIVQLASIYSLVSLGFYITLDMIGLINLAHGELILIGAYSAWWLNHSFRLDPLISLLMISPLMFGFGYLLYQQRFYRQISQISANVVIASFAVSMILRNLFPLVLTNNPRTVESFFSGYWQIGTLYFPMMRSILTILAFVVIASLIIFFRKSRLGKSLRSVAQNPQAAVMIGIDVEQIRAIALGLAFLLAGLTGVLISPVYTLSPALGQWFTLKCVAVVFLTWRRGLLGLVAGALLLALMETTLATYVQGIGVSVSELSAPTIIFCAILLRWRTLVGGLASHV